MPNNIVPTLEDVRDVLVVNSAPFDAELAHAALLAALDFAVETSNVVAVVAAIEALANLHGLSAAGTQARPAGVPKPTEAGNVE